MVMYTKRKACELELHRPREEERPGAEFRQQGHPMFNIYVDLRFQFLDQEKEKWLKARYMHEILSNADFKQGPAYF